MEDLRIKTEIIIVWESSMGFFSFLNSGTKAAENATDIAKTLTGGIVNGIDALVLTDEERIQYRADAVKVQLKFWEAFGKENTDQSKARRELAKATFYVYFFLILSGAVVYKFDQSYAIYLFKIVESLTWLVGMIAAAYFVPHQVSKVYKNK